MTVVIAEEVSSLPLKVERLSASECYSLVWIGPKSRKKTANKA